MVVGFYFDGIERLGYDFLDFCSYGVEGDIYGVMVVVCTVDLVFVL